MNRIFTILSFCILSSIGLSAFAQDDNLNKEIVIEKDYKPIEQKATRISLSPEVVHIDPSTSQLSFSMQNSPVATGNEIFTLPAFGYLTDKPYTDPRGYLNYAMGSYLNIAGSLGYKILDSRRTTLSVWANHLSSSAMHNDYDFQKQDYGSNVPFNFKQRWFDEHLGLNLSQNVGKGTLISALKYHFAKTLLWGHVQDRQSYSTSNNVDFSIGFNNFNSKNSLKYHADFDIDYFRNKTDFSYYMAEFDAIPRTNQTYFRLTTGMAKEYSNNIRFGLDLGFEHIITDFTHVSHNDYITAPDNFSILTLSPYFAKVKDNFTYSLGIDLGINFFDSSKFRIFPKVKASYEPFRGFTIYGTATGGSDFNRFSNLLNTCRYNLTYELIKPSVTKADTRLGFIIGPFKGFSIGFYGGYANVKDALRKSTSWLTFDYESNNQTSISTPLTATPEVFYNFVDASGFLWGADIDYKYSGLIEFHLGMKYANQNSHDTGYSLGLDMPEWELDSRVSVTPIDRLRIDLAYDWRGNRKVNRRRTNLDDVSNLQFHAYYQINKLLGVSLQASNLLDRKWQESEWYRAQGIAFMAGVSLTLQ